METAPWQRHLLSLAEEHGEGIASLTAETVAISVAAAVVLLLVVLLCACDRKQHKDKTELQGAVRKSTVSTRASSNVEDPFAVNVEVPVDREPTQITGSPGEPTQSSNGVAGRNSTNAMSHVRQASSGSGQMRPTSLRELPDLPGSNHKRNPSGAGVIDKPAGTRNNQQAGGGEEGDHSSYDHLGAKINNSSKGATNYDHINLESPHDLGSGATPISESDAAFDGHYAQVRERTYDVVQDIRSRASAQVAAPDYDPYSKVKDDDDREDPYAKVKDTDKDDADDDYAHLRHDHVITTPAASNSAGGTGVDEEDPYERVMGDSASTQVKVTAGGRDADDPYTQVGDESTVMVVPIRSGSALVQATGDASNVKASAGSSAARLTKGEHFKLQFADEETEGQDDYAVVVKDHLGSMSREESSSKAANEDDVEEIEPYFSAPPEPPRMYGASEVSSLEGAVGGMDPPPNKQRQAKEHRYTKVTARESLASMSARNALNTYETVPDLPENTYATVEGGSGDGVVRYCTPSQPTLRHSSSRLSETYAEIGASASGSYTPSAPEPPSLDSLHNMTKSTTSNDGDHGNRGLGSPSGSAGGITMTEDGYAVVTKTSNFSPSETALPQIPQATTSGSVHSMNDLGEDVMINGVTLHPDYHRVKDCIPDQDSENDPNYESVDEALSKAPATLGSAGSPETASTPTPRVTALNFSSSSPTRRTHEYEEVSPPTSPVASAPSAGHASGMFSANAPNGRSSNGAVPSGALPKVNTSNRMSPATNAGSVEAAEVRERVLQGHMYEDISEVKKTKNNPQNIKHKPGQGSG